MNYIQILQNILKHSQALYQDGTIYWSGDEILITPERKAVVDQSIHCLKSALDSLELDLSEKLSSN